MTATAARCGTPLSEAAPCGFGNNTNKKQLNKDMKTKRRTTTDRLGAYLTATVGTSLLAAVQSDAAIVTLDISAFDSPNAGLMPDSDSSAYLLPGNKIFIYTYNSWAGVAADWDGPLNLAMKSDGSGLFKFGPGDVIGAGIGPSANWSSDRNNNTYFNREGAKQPSWGASSFIGFQANSATTPLYGWLEVTWDAPNNTFEFLSGAYEDSGASITLAIPEPVSMLSTMGMLASGLLIRRRKLAA